MVISRAAEVNLTFVIDCDADLFIKINNIDWFKMSADTCTSSFLGYLKRNNFPFGTNGKLIISGAPVEHNTLFFLISFNLSNNLKSLCFPLSNLVL